MEQKNGNEMIRFTIPLPPVTKKNSQEIMVRGGKPFVMPSKKYREYEAQALWFVPRRRNPIAEPVNVKCLFYMPTRRRCDLTNLEEAVDDIMVKAGLLADDNYTIIAGHDGSRVFYDKDRPRTEIKIERITGKDSEK